MGRGSRQIGTHRNLVRLIHAIGKGVLNPSLLFIMASKPKKPIEPETTETEQEAPEKASVKLVKMVRDEAPFTADVHPAEVENFNAVGWRIAE